MASPIPIRKTPSLYSASSVAISKAEESLPAPQSNKLCMHHCRAPLDTAAATATTKSMGDNGDTPPMTPISKDKCGQADCAASLCSCSLAADEGYQILSQSEFTPPRTPPKAGLLGLSGGGVFSRKRAAKEVNRATSSNNIRRASSSSSTTSSSEYVLVDPSTSASSTTSSPSFVSTSEICHAPSSSPLPLPEPFPPPGEFSFYNDSRPFGIGAWSTVHRGLFTSHFSSNPSSGPTTIAIKLPSSPAAHSILHNEAAILAYLTRPTPTPNIISLIGYDPKTSAILLPAHPLTMESFVRTQSTKINSEEYMSLKTMRCPVVGMRQWLYWAQELCKAFVALKSKGVVHGDVKWGNILLREIQPEDNLDVTTWGDDYRGGGGDGKIRRWEQQPLYHPVIVDFSSAHVMGRRLPDLAQQRSHDVNGISALTVSFCAPELLAKFNTPPTPSQGTSNHPPPPPIPTFSTDLYSLAITLLTAAIGSDPYSVRGASDVRKGMWVMCGDPIGFARGDERGLRVARGGAVEEVLTGCFGKSEVGRVHVEEVERRVKDVVGRWVREDGRGDSRWGC